LVNNKGKGMGETELQLHGNEIEKLELKGNKEKGKRLSGPRKEEYLMVVIP
jgi:hypothetical protein